MLDAGDKVTHSCHDSSSLTFPSLGVEVKKVLQCRKLLRHNGGYMHEGQVWCSSEDMEKVPRVREITV